MKNHQMDVYRRDCSLSSTIIASYVKKSFHPESSWFRLSVAGSDAELVFGDPTGIQFENPPQACSRILRSAED